MMSYVLRGVFAAMSWCVEEIKNNEIYDTPKTPELA